MKKMFNVKNKIKNKKGPARTCFKGGFALLFSVLIASLLLTIGLSIFNIALKELAISTATQRSIHAFYAADSGRECIIYWSAVNDSSVFNLNAYHSASSEDKEITCGEFTGDITVTYSEAVAGSPGEYNKLEVSVLPDNPLYPIYLLVASDSETNFGFDLEKVKIVDGGSATTTTIINSYGYDSDGSDRIERAIEQTM